MWRAFAYLVVPIGALGAIGGTIVGVWSLFEGNYKGSGAMFACVAFWSWATISAYKHEIKKPRDERKRLCTQANDELGDFLKPGIPVADAIQKVRTRFPLIGYPRHRSSADFAFDNAVELETKDFTIWLFGKDGALKAWVVR